MATVVQKTPTEDEDFTIDWSTRGLGTDAISTSTWSVTPAGLATHSTSTTSTTATVWLSGGTSGQAYTVTNTITTTGGRTYQQPFQVFIYP